MGFQYTFPLSSYHSKDVHRDAGGRWNGSVGGNTTMKHGEGTSSALVGVGYTPTAGTDVNVQCHLDVEGDGKEQYKVRVIIMET